MVRDGDGFRQSTFSNFAFEALRNSNDIVKPLMAAAKRLSLALSAVTTMQSALAEEADPHAEGVEEQ